MGCDAAIANDVVCKARGQPAGKGIGKVIGNDPIAFDVGSNLDLYLEGERKSCAVIGEFQLWMANFRRLFELALNPRDHIGRPHPNVLLIIGNRRATGETDAGDEQAELAATADHNAPHRRNCA